MDPEKKTTEMWICGLWILVLLILRFDFEIFCPFLFKFSQIFFRDAFLPCHISLRTCVFDKFSIVQYGY